MATRSDRASTDRRGERRRHRRRRPAGMWGLEHRGWKMLLGHLSGGPQEMLCPEPRRAGSMTSIGPCQTCSLLTVFGARPHSAGQSHRLKQRVPQANPQRHTRLSRKRIGSGRGCRGRPKHSQSLSRRVDFAVSRWPRSHRGGDPPRPGAPAARTVNSSWDAAGGRRGTTPRQSPHTHPAAPSSR